MGVYAMEGKLNPQRPPFFTPSITCWLTFILSSTFRSLMPPLQLHLPLLFGFE